MVRLCDIVANQAAPVASDGNRLWAERVRRWRRLAPQIGIWDYGVTYVVTGAPYPAERVIPEDLRFYADLGVRFMFMEMEYPHLADMYALKIWMTMKLMEDPYLDAAALYHTFMTLYYGDAAPALMEFRDRVAEYAASTKAYIDWFAKSTMQKHLNAVSVPLMQACFDRAEEAVAGDPARLERVRRARIGLDRISYMLFPQWLAEFERAGHPRDAFPLNRDLIFKRAEAYRLAAIEKLDPKAVGRNKQWYRDEAIKEIRRYAKIPLTSREPSRFAGKAYFDYPATDGYVWNDAAALVEDPDAETGLVLRVDVGETISPKFKMPLGYGAYVAGTGESIGHNSIAKIAGPGYQWYKLMTIKPPPSTYFFVTNHWEIQFHTGDPAPGLDESYEVWLRLKCTGPAYLPQDKAHPNALYIERMVLLPRPAPK